MVGVSEDEGLSASAYYRNCIWIHTHAIHYPLPHAPPSPPIRRVIVCLQPSLLWLWVWSIHIVPPTSPLVPSPEFGDLLFLPGLFPSTPEQTAASAVQIGRRVARTHSLFETLGPPSISSTAPERRQLCRFSSIHQSGIRTFFSLSYYAPRHSLSQPGASLGCKAPISLPPSRLLAG